MLFFRTLQIGIVTTAPLSGFRTDVINTRLLILDNPTGPVTGPKSHDCFL